MPKDAGYMNIFHLHIYYEAETSDFAGHLRLDVLENLDVVDCSPLISKNVGPHTSSMFEVSVTDTKLEKVVGWLERNRNGLSVLIHPVQKDEYEAHTVKAKWLGRPLPINLDRLESNADVQVL